MSHIVMAKEYGELVVDFTDAMSTIEANTAASVYTSESDPSSSDVETAHDACLDSFRETLSDLSSTLADLKTACGLSGE